jgi:hypothetical protein
MRGWTSSIPSKAGISTAPGIINSLSFPTQSLMADIFLKYWSDNFLAGPAFDLTGTDSPLLMI